MLKIGHSITRPGRRHGDAPVDINVPEELETVPGIVQRPPEVDFYSREYPLESQQIDYTADREWVWTVYTDEMAKYRKHHDDVNEPLVNAAAVSGSPFSGSPIQSHGVRPLRTAAATFLAMTPSVSPNTARRSAWPISA
mgnify:CR=1 FL=1